MFAATACWAAAPDAHEVLASSFGWNATNATAALQAALDSGADKVVIDRQSGDWIVEPVFLRSNQEVVLDEGVIVRARKGAFKGKNDCLFTARGVTNAVLRGNAPGDCPLPLLRMERNDYADRSAYCFSEWRHTLRIVDSANVRVSDLAFRHSGGDGIYVGGRSENVEIRRVDCSDHYRQGISVTGAHGLVIADSRFTATKGTPPQCGIDFEPNKPTDRLSGCLVENCDFNGNASSGILFHLTNLDETTEPVSITVKKCRARDNVANGLTMTVGANGRRKPVRGGILIENCLFAGNRARAMVVNGVSRDTASVTVADTVLDARGSDWAGLLVSNNGLMADAANLTFKDCRLVADRGPTVEFSGLPGVGIESVGGSLAVERGGVAEPFDFAALAARNPPHPELREAFGIGFVDYRTLRPIAPKAVVETATPMCRGRFTFLQYLPAEGDYTLAFRTQRIGNRPLNTSVQMRDMAGTDLGVFCLTNEVQSVTIRTSDRNLRRFEIDTRGNAVAISSPHPGQGLLADVPLNLFRESRRLYFHVPADAAKVHVAVAPEEPAAATLLNADDTPVATMPRQATAAALTSDRGIAAAAEVWSLEVDAEEDVMLRLGASVLPVFAVEEAAGFAKE